MFVYGFREAPDFEGYVYLEPMAHERDNDREFVCE